MSLSVGARLAHYDVTALIGEGGMGQLWQATDTKLNRQEEIMHSNSFIGFLFVTALLASTGCGGPESEASAVATEPAALDAESALIARAAELELDTEYAMVVTISDV